MDELDSDECLLKHGNLVAKRDIVQSVLEEIPYQVTSYCKANKIQPMNA
uniref:DNA polymerase III subunit epsilon n=1 Tax=Meloidogyne hapla TaxID=6305 RepID=A0A1I8AZM4_MELHA